MPIQKVRTQKVGCMLQVQSIFVLGKILNSFTPKVTGIIGRSKLLNGWILYLYQQFGHGLPHVFLAGLPQI